MKYRSSGSVSTAVGALVTAGGADGTARNSSAGRSAARGALPVLVVLLVVGWAAAAVVLRGRAFAAVVRAATSRALDFAGSRFAGVVFLAVSEDPFAGFRRLRGAGVLPSAVLTAPILH
ncbi:hypothetical protein GCM10027258_66000 [Amycolatopsis stemonae]